MILKLRRRLALLLICVVSAAIVCTAAAALIATERQLSGGEQARFDAQVSKIAQDVRINGVLRASDLAKTEAANNLIISISDAGGPIPFRGGWRPATDRQTLISRALSAAPGAIENWNGVVAGDFSERYLAAIRRIDRYRSARTVVVLQDMRAADAQRIAQRIVYAAIAAAALCALSVFCWFFTGRATRPIREAYERQNQFVAAASHDLRTPLQAIWTSAEALRLNPPDSEAFIGRIIAELSNMSRLTEDLLLLTAASNRGPLDNAPVEITALTQNALDCLGAAARQKGVTLAVAGLPSPPPMLIGSEVLLKRALNALIDNAICYTPPGGHVSVSAAALASGVEICVKDDGPGIAFEHRARIFERFYRIDTSRTDRLHSGLGLSVAQSIVESHGGRLTYSPVVPHGSRFCIVLPVIQKVGQLAGPGRNR